MNATRYLAPQYVAYVSHFLDDAWGACTVGAGTDWLVKLITMIHIVIGRVWTIVYMYICLGDNNTCHRSISIVLFPVIPHDLAVKSKVKAFPDYSIFTSVSYDDGRSLGASHILLCMVFIGGG